MNEITPERKQWVSDREYVVIEGAGPITPERIAEWRALAEAATEGPWESSPIEPPSEDGPWLAHVMHHVGQSGYGFVLEAAWDGDAAFIAAARTAVPALLAEVERLTRLLGSHADGHRCTCKMTRPATHIEPAEWEQDAWCLTHPDVAQIRAEVEHNKDALFVRAERAERARDEAERAADEAERDAGVMLARAETAEANLAASMEAHAGAAGEVARLREGLEALAAESLSIAASAVRRQGEQDPDVWDALLRYLASRSKAVHTIARALLGPSDGGGL